MTFSSQVLEKKKFKLAIAQNNCTFFTDSFLLVSFQSKFNSNPNTNYSKQQLLWWSTLGSEKSNKNKIKKIGRAMQARRKLYGWRHIKIEARGKSKLQFHYVCNQMFFSPSLFTALARLDLFIFFYFLVSLSCALWQNLAHGAIAINCKQILNEKKIKRVQRGLMAGKFKEVLNSALYK